MIFGSVDFADCMTPKSWLGRTVKFAAAGRFGVNAIILDDGIFVLMAQPKYPVEKSLHYVRDLNNANL